ncbi:hypothetical protein ACJJTC_005575 [Scirpophaga incertulas]
MNFTMHLAVVAAVCLCLADAGPEVRVARAKQRPTRGFKNVEMMTARGFGKRDRPSPRAEQEFDAPLRKIFHPKSTLLVAPDFGKRDGNDDSEEVYGLDNFWELLEASPERDGLEGNDEKSIESIPLDWFVNEMINNPDFTRSVVRKFVDTNQDGQLTSEELLRNVV